MSMKTRRAPRRRYALVVLTNVKEGTITSSPGFRSSNRADISSAWVHEVVRRTFGAPRRLSNNWLHFLVKGPSPDVCPLLIASAMYVNSFPARQERLNGT